MHSAINYYNTQAVPFDEHGFIEHTVRNHYDNNYYCIGENGIIVHVHAQQHEAPS